MDAYSGLALVYDELMNDVNYKNWFKYIKKNLEQRNFKPNTVLEMACGTGKFTKLLCEEKYDVTCFDISEDMLSIAYNKLDSYDNIKILKQNMVDFKLFSKFDLILCLCDSINYITEYNKLIDVFKNAYNHLNKNSFFVFDINSYYKLFNIIADNVFVEDRDKIFYVWENYPNISEAQIEFYLTFFIKDNNKYVRFDEKHIQKAYKINDIISALNKAGFKDISYSESYSLRQVGNESERISFIVRK